MNRANSFSPADRATTVVGGLVKMAIAPARLSSAGYGEAYPVADNATRKGHQKNRRVLMRATKK